MFKVRNLNKKIQAKQILKDIDFEIEHGEIAIFLGGSGAGKSTLLRLINQLDKYDQGTFILDDETLQNHSVGMVFQNFNLFEHLSVLENLILPLTKCKKMPIKEADNLAKNLLKRYELEDKVKDRISKLSGGQKQRLAIARALAMDPKIICLDEPTSALDPYLTHQVAKFITELAEEKRIILLTTHDMNLLKQLKGKLFLIENATIVENAKTEEYFSYPQKFPKLQQFIFPQSSS